MRINDLIIFALNLTVLVIATGMYFNGFQSHGVAFTLGVMVMSVLGIALKTFGFIETAE